MRIYTDEEKAILIRLRDNQGGYILNFMRPVALDVVFEIDVQNEQVAFTLTIDDPNRIDLANIIQARVQELQIILIRTVNLIRLFEEKGYIFRFKNAHQFPNPIITGGFIGGHSIKYTFPDPKITKLVCEFATQEIIVNDGELNKFINSGFITREEVRANRQFYTTLAALIVAISALIINIIINITKDKKNEHNYRRHSEHCQEHRRN